MCALTATVLWRAGDAGEDLFPPPPAAAAVCLSLSGRAMTALCEGQGALKHAMHLASFNGLTARKIGLDDSHDVAKKLARPLKK